MKPILKIAVFAFCFWIVALASCKKPGSPLPVQANTPPIARAGQDISSGYDCNANNATLTGTASSDPDGRIISYLWTKISGAAQATIVNPGSAITLVNNLTAGTYGFKLTVTDRDGVTDDDTVLITVIGVNRPIINAQLVPFGTLSQARSDFTVAAAGSKIVFAGGLNTVSYVSSARVDIFDNSTNTWTIAELSQARYGMTAAVLENKILFAGGNIESGNTSSTVDIYDVASNTWTIANLSESRSEIAAGVVGNKVLFAGGYTPNGCCNGYSMFSKRVDIYDGSTGNWSVSALSEERVGIVASTAGSKIYFAGGTRFYGIFDYNPLDRIDIYDAISNSWSASNLSEARGWIAGIAINNKIYWAGGNPMPNDIDKTNLVEIRDINTQASSFACLFQQNAGFNAVSKSNQIVFFTGQGDVANKFDVYNVISNVWSIGVVTQEIRDAAIISVNNIIYVAGGSVNGVLSNQVWKLEF